jgi:hypothetical protein
MKRDPMIKSPPKQFLNPETLFHQNGRNTKFTTCDFWQWAFSDLQMNDIRGVLAEYIVAKALDIPLNVRNTWDDYDLETPGGLKIEVKSGGYLQSWDQKGLSKITFGGLRGQAWDREQCCYLGESLYRADVYVFAVQTAETHEAFNPLDLSQWEFYILPVAVISKRGTKSIALSVVRKLTAPVGFDALASEMKEKVSETRDT